MLGSAKQANLSQADHTMSWCQATNKQTFLVFFCEDVNDDDFVSAAVMLVFLLAYVHTYVCILFPVGTFPVKWKKKTAA